MKKIYLKDVGRAGLFPEISTIAPICYEVIATIPVVEELQEAGAIVRSFGHFFGVQLGERMPSGIIAVHLNRSPYTGLRLENEPAYPFEWFDYWKQVDFLPCPVCAAPVIWYEAGFVPGYRICTKYPHHHCLAT